MYLYVYSSIAIPFDNQPLHCLSVSVRASKTLKMRTKIEIQTERSFVVAAENIFLTIFDLVLMKLCKVLHAQSWLRS